MSDKVRIALDAMGGDQGPAVVVAGADLALTRHPETEFLFFGNTRAGRAARRRAARAQSRLKTRPHRHRGAHGGQAEPGLALWPVEILDVARHRRGQERRRRRRGVGRQYRRADGDVEVQSQDLARHRAAGDRGAVADLARRIRGARRRRLDRRRCRPPRRSRRDGRRHRAHPVRPSIARPSGFSISASKKPRASNRCAKPPPSCASRNCPTSNITASSKATTSARAPSTSSSPKALPATLRSRPPKAPRGRSANISKAP